MIDLPALLSSERISCGCDIRSKKRALQTVAELLGESLRADRTATDAEGTGELEPSVSDMVILDALITRERLGSTGIGHGIALPHARLAHLDEPLAALITLETGVDFESIDGEPVDIVFGLLVPEHCNDEHLKILAELARRFGDERLRERLRACENGDDLLRELSAAPVG